MNRSGIYGQTVIYNPQLPGGFVDGQDAINSVPDGGTFYLNGVWDCRDHGGIVLTRPINIKGAGWSFLNRGRLQGAYFLNEAASGPETVIEIDCSANQAMGVKLSNFGMVNLKGYGIVQRRTPNTVHRDLFFDCRGGRGAVQFGEGVFFTVADNVIVQNFSHRGYDISGTGNDYTFRNCDIRSKHPTCEAGIYCVNSGLTVYQGQIEAVNDTGTGAGIYLFRDEAKRGRNALLFGVYAENSDCAVRIGGNYPWLGAQIIAPHWSLMLNEDGSRRRVGCGLAVENGEHIHLERPQVYNWDNRCRVADLREGAADCSVVLGRPGQSGKIRNLGRRNRVVDA